MLSSTGVYAHVPVHPHDQFAQYSMHVHVSAKSFNSRVQTPMAACRSLVENVARDSYEERGLLPPTAE